MAVTATQEGSNSLLGSDQTPMEVVEPTAPTRPSPAVEIVDLTDGNDLSAAEMQHQAATATTDNKLGAATSGEAPTAPPTAQENGTTTGSSTAGQVRPSVPWGF